MQSVEPTRLNPVLKRSRIDSGCRQLTGRHNPVLMFSEFGDREVW